MASQARSSFKTNRRREMECAVCLDKLCQPKMLSCFHNFCAKCLEGLIQDQKISCPTCRKETTLGSKDIGDLPKNIALVGIMNTLCEICLDRDREVCCDHCSLWLCSHCLEGCKRKQSLSDKAKSYRKELLDREKQLFDHKINLTETVDSVRDRMEAYEAEAAKNVRFNMQRLRDKLQQEQDRQLGVLEKQTKTISDLRNEMFQTTERVRLNNENLSENELETYIDEWNTAMKNSDKDISMISQVSNTIKFVPNQEVTSIGKLMLNPNYESAQFEHFRFGSEGSAIGQFDCPSRVATSPVTGNLIVLESRNNRIQVYNQRYEFKLEFGSKGEGDGQFNLSGRAGGVAVTEDGLIVVADTQNHRLQVFTERGVFVKTIGSNGSEPGQFNEPQGLVIHDSLIFVCDQNNYRIQVLEVAGKFIRQLGSRDLFTPVRPQDVSICNDGDVAVVAVQSEPGDGKLVVFSAEGEHKITLGTNTSPVKLQRPLGVTTDHNGHILVSDLHTHKIHILTSSWKLLRTLGCEGQGPGQLKYPLGLACREDGSIVVSEWGNHRIQVFSVDC